VGAGRGAGAATGIWLPAGVGEAAVDRGQASASVDAADPDVADPDGPADACGSTGPEPPQPDNSPTTANSVASRPTVDRAAIRIGR
ncbi:MAG TPA: hypothetical protein VFC19_05040, partial [Candidatus Limnocylindrales bacterium]|nr:hypothetical protein [Candidatus Limnocylindrales bacterium]